MAYEPQMADDSIERAKPAPLPRPDVPTAHAAYQRSQSVPANVGKPEPAHPFVNPWGNVWIWMLSTAGADAWQKAIAGADVDWRYVPGHQPQSQLVRDGREYQKEVRDTGLVIPQLGPAGTAEFYRFLIQRHGREKAVDILAVGNRNVWSSRGQDNEAISEAMLFGRLLMRQQGVRSFAGGGEILDEVFTKAQQGHLPSQEQIILANQGLVWKMAKKYAGKDLEVEDLAQEGNIGLLRALKDFDPARGKFSTHATWWARSFISRAAEKARKQTRGAGDLEETSLEELAIDPSARPDTLAAASEHRERLQEMLSSLDARSAEIVRMRFGLGEHEPHTLAEIGQKFGVTREAIRQIEARALEAMRNKSVVVDRPKSSPTEELSISDSQKPDKSSTEPKEPPKTSANAPASEAQPDLFSGQDLPGEPVSIADLFGAEQPKPWTQGRMFASGGQIGHEGIAGGSYIIKASAARAIGPEGQRALGAAKVPPGFPHDSFRTSIAETGEPIAVESDELIVPPAVAHGLGCRTMERLNQADKGFADGGETPDADAPTKITPLGEVPGVTPQVPNVSNPGLRKHLENLARQAAVRKPSSSQLPPPLDIRREEPPARSRLSRIIPLASAAALYGGISGYAIAKMLGFSKGGHVGSFSDGGSEEDIPYAELAPEPLFSKLGEVLSHPGLPGKAQSITPFLAKHGVSKEEMEWTNISKAIEGKKQISRAELRQYFDENRVRVQDVLKEHPSNSRPVQWQTDTYQVVDTGETETTATSDRGGYTIVRGSGQYARYWFIHKGDDKEPSDIASSLADAKHRVEGAIYAAEAGPQSTQYSQYQSPGGKNYRELLLTLPFKQSGMGNYKSPHWSEPNILAHIRFNDRIGPEGEKILHIEEVQSDWLQELQEHFTPRKLKQWNKFEGRPDDDRIYFESHNRHAPGIYTRKGSTTFQVDSGEREARPVFASFEEAKQYAQQIYEKNLEENRPIDDAPFRESWHALAMKRMIHFAAENSYDKLTWNPGEQIQKLVGGEEEGQNEFYDTKLVNWAQKFGKKYGADVGTHIYPGASIVNRGADLATHSLPITPAMRKDVLAKGLPMFAEGGEVDDYFPETTFAEGGEFRRFTGGRTVESIKREQPQNYVTRYLPSAARSLSEAAQVIHKEVPKENPIVVLGRDMWPVVPALRASGRSAQYFLWSRLQGAFNPSSSYGYNDKIDLSTRKQWLREVPPLSHIFDTGFAGSIFNAIHVMDQKQDKHRMMLMMSSGDYETLPRISNRSYDVESIENLPKLVSRTIGYTRHGAAKYSRMFDDDEGLPAHFGRIERYIPYAELADQSEQQNYVDAKSVRLPAHWENIVNVQAMARENYQLLRAMGLSDKDALQYATFTGATPQERIGMSSPEAVQEHYAKVKAQRAQHYATGGSVPAQPFLVKGGPHGVDSPQHIYDLPVGSVVVRAAMMDQVKAMAKGGQPHGTVRAMLGDGELVVPPGTGDAQAALRLNAGDISAAPHIFEGQQKPLPLVQGTPAPLQPPQIFSNTALNWVQSQGGIDPLGHGESGERKITIPEEYFDFYQSDKKNPLRKWVEKVQAGKITKGMQKVVGWKKNEKGQKDIPVMQDLDKFGPFAVGGVGADLLGERWEREAIGMDRSKEPESFAGEAGADERLHTVLLEELNTAKPIPPPSIASEYYAWQAANEMAEIQQAKQKELGTYWRRKASSAAAKLPRLSDEPVAPVQVKEELPEWVTSDDSDLLPLKTVPVAPLAPLARSSASRPSVRTAPGGNPRESVRAAAAFNPDLVRELTKKPVPFEPLPETPVSSMFSPISGYPLIANIGIPPIEPPAVITGSGEAPQSRTTLEVEPKARTVFHRQPSGPVRLDPFFGKERSARSRETKRFHPEKASFPRVFPNSVILPNWLTETLSKQEPELWTGQVLTLPGDEPEALVPAMTPAPLPHERDFQLGRASQLGKTRGKQGFSETPAQIHRPSGVEVSKFSEGNWIVHQGGTGAGRYDTEEDAIAAARAIEPGFGGGGEEPRRATMMPRPQAGFHPDEQGERRSNRRGSYLPWPLSGVHDWSRAYHEARHPHSYSGMLGGGNMDGFMRDLKSAIIDAIKQGFERVSQDRPHEVQRQSSTPQAKPASERQTVFRTPVPNASRNGYSGQQPQRNLRG